MSDVDFWRLTRQRSIGLELTLPLAANFQLKNFLSLRLKFQQSFIRLRLHAAMVPPVFSG